jgi:hypothetical protein
MEPCKLCGAKIYEECLDPECPNWDRRFDEIFSLFDLDSEYEIQKSGGYDKENY